MVKQSNPLSWKVDFHQDGHSQQLHCTASVKMTKTDPLQGREKKKKRVKKEGEKRKKEDPRQRNTKGDGAQCMHFEVCMSVHVVEWCSLRWCVMCYPKSNPICAWCLLPFGQLVCPRRTVCLPTVSCTEALSAHSQVCL